MKKVTLVVVGVLFLVGLAACGGSSGGGGGDITGNIKSVSVVSSTTTGDFTPSVVANVGSDGQLKLTASGVDVDGDGTVETPTVTSVKVSTAAASVIKSLSSETVTCDDGTDVGGGGTDDTYDIGISLDTTGSMGAAASILADKIVAFTNSLADAGVNAKFTGITTGDSFATKKASGSVFTDDVSKGSLGTPPSFQGETSCERPDTDAALLDDDDMETFFTAVKTAYPIGCNGGDMPENYLGSVQYLFDETTWRSGSVRIIITIGDNCAHTPTTAEAAGITEVWLPPEPTNIEEALAGNAAVHVINNLNPQPDYDDPDLTCEEGNYYNMKGLAEATGGTFIELGDCTTEATCNVDLTTLPILSTITKGINYLCDGRSTFYGAAGNYTFTVRLSATGHTSGTTEDATVTIILTLTFE